MAGTLKLLESAITIQNLSHTYVTDDGQPRPALALINLTIKPKEFVAIVGPSGCGKSTLINLIAGLMEPTSGTISVDGAPVLEARKERKLGLVFQDPVLLPWRDITENIRLPLELSGLRNGQREEVQTLINLVMLGGFEHNFPRELSGGMRSRVALARALVLSPTILLMDEPFGSLDEITAHSLNRELLKIWAERRPTIVLVTHSISQAVFMADRVITLSSRPGSILRETAVDLPRPRTSDTLALAHFVELNTEVRQGLIESFKSGTKGSPQ
jgi:NitT/TauT family transport system ATP-binding protein